MELGLLLQGVGVVDQFHFLNVKVLGMMDGRGYSVAFFVFFVEFKMVVALVVYNLQILEFSNQVESAP